MGGLESPSRSWQGEHLVEMAEPIPRSDARPPLGTPNNGPLNVEKSTKHS